MVVVFYLTIAVLAPSSLAGQQDWDVRRVYMTREELQELLARLESTALSSAYSASLQARARNETELIRTRLAEGDFQVGDRILLDVEDQEALSDTFTVDRGRVLSLPTIGEVSLAGLLRADLEPTLTEYLGRFIREPRVRARSLLPITISGGVSAPGFHTLLSETRLADALMIAGGTTASAELMEIRIERGGEEIWDEESIQRAIAEGRTLDQLSMRPGDMIVVPDRGQGIGRTETTLRSIGILLSIPLSIVALIAIF